MKYYLDYTPHNTLRLWLALPDYPIDREIDFLSALTIWGGCDKRGEGYLSFEFDCVLHYFLHRLASRLNWQETVEGWD